jgi:hypothetical protein
MCSATRLPQSSQQQLLGYATPTLATRWQPTEGIVGHGGQPLDPAREFFSLPPAEIGEVISAHTTLLRGKEPFSIGTRVSIVLLPAAAVMGIAYLIATQNRREADTILCLGIAVASAAMATAWYFTRFRHICSYAGSEGLAVFGMPGSRAATLRSSIFMFERAAELRTKQTRRFINGFYFGTTYDFIWTDAHGRFIYWLKGSYRSQAGTPKADDRFWIGVAGERAWNARQLDLLQRQLDACGYCQFNLFNGDFVRVGRGFFEFGRRGETARIETQEVKTLSLDGGQFAIHHKDAKWFGRAGKYRFSYGDMANAQLFLIAIERLSGFSFK